MSGRGLAALLAAASLAILAFGNGSPLGGIAAQDVVALLVYGAVSLWLTGWAVETARGPWRNLMGIVVMWVIFIASVTGLYVKREAVVDGLRGMAEDVGLNQPATTVTASGEISIPRRRDGTYRVPASINDTASLFLFDTGASSVVLTAETAEEIGLKPQDLRFRVPVVTANGRTMTAPVTIARLTIGPIRLEGVPALVAAPGRLQENLLGQTVLDRPRILRSEGGPPRPAGEKELRRVRTDETRPHPEVLGRRPSLEGGTVGHRTSFKACSAGASG